MRSLKNYQLPYHAQTLFADKALPDPKTLRSEQQTSHDAQSDPLIAHGWQKATYIGTALLAFGFVALVGIFSRKVEHMIVAALMLTLVIIGFFVFVGR